MSTSGASAPGAGSDEARDDLMATLAAARELHPEMDTALADQYLARRQEQQQRAAQQPAPFRRSHGEADRRSR